MRCFEWVTSGRKFRQKWTFSKRLLFHVYRSIQWMDLPAFICCEANWYSAAGFNAEYAELASVRVIKDGNLRSYDQLRFTTWYYTAPNAHICVLSGIWMKTTWTCRPLSRQTLINSLDKHCAAVLGRLFTYRFGCPGLLSLPALRGQ